jgi:glycosyltransferase involved in cell wall biosynthesis
MKPTLSIIIPTIARPSLERTLQSIPDLPELEIVLIGDGVGSHALAAHHARAATLMITREPRSFDCGYNPRNLGLVAAAGEWVTFIDDDDYYTADGVQRILDFCDRRVHERPRPAVFKMQRPGFNDHLWHSPNLEPGNQGLQQFVCPNTVALPRFLKHYSADFNFMQSVAWMHAGCEFLEQVTVVMPKQNLGV